MKKLISLVSIMMIGATLAPTLASADRRNADRRDHDRRDRDRWRPAREVRHSHRHHDRGSWHHGTHNGHLGWWFVLAGTWYAINRASYEAQAEPVIVQQPVAVQPPTTTLYYCRSTNSYYPYVASCTEGWQQVATTPVQ